MSLKSDDAKDPLERDVEYVKVMNDLPEIEMDKEKVIRYTLIKIMKVKDT